MNAIYRTLCAVERVTSYAVVLRIPGLGASMRFGVNKEDIPFSCVPGLRFWAMLNLEATRTSELHMEMFEYGEVLTPERLAQIDKDLGLK